MFLRRLKGILHVVDHGIIVVLRIDKYRVLATRIEEGNSFENSSCDWVVA